MFYSSQLKFLSRTRTKNN